MSTPPIDCKEDPVIVEVAARVDVDPLLMISTFPEIWVMPPKFTVATVSAMITFP